MDDRPNMEYLARIMAANPGKPVVCTSQKGWYVYVTDVRNEEYEIRVVIQVDN